MRVKITKNVTGDPYLLAYNEGDEVELEDALAKELINDGVAIPVAKNEKKENAKAEKSDAETR